MQVGKDQGAQQFLQLLDSNRDIGDVVDAVSYYGEQLAGASWDPGGACGP